MATEFGVALGAMLSVRLSGQVLLPFDISPLRVLLGSFLTVFGARCVFCCCAVHAKVSLIRVDVGAGWLAVAPVGTESVAAAF